MIDSGRRSNYTMFSPPEPRKPLTEQQQAIARLLAQGFYVKQIGAALSPPITEESVHYHIRQAAYRLSLPDSEDLSPRDQLLVWAFWEYRKDRKQGAA